MAHEVTVEIKPIGGRTKRDKSFTDMFDALAWAKSQLALATDDPPCCAEVYVDGVHVGDLVQNAEVL